MKKKKALVSFLLALVIVVVAVSSFVIIRQLNYNFGREQGYLIGYSIGHTDKSNGNKQDSQELAWAIVPYEYGNGKWKGFMMGFPEGYNDGFSEDSTKTK